MLFNFVFEAVVGPAASLMISFVLKAMAEALFCHMLTDSSTRSELSMFLRVQLFSRNVAGLLSLRSRSGHRFAMIHHHCIQQIFHMPLIQLNMPPKIIHRNSTFEKMGLFLMLRPQAHNFSLLHQEVILEFVLPTIPNCMSIHTEKSPPCCSKSKLSQNRF